MNIPDSTHDLQAECRRHMTANGLSYDGEIIADGKYHRYSIDQKKNQPDEWYVASEGVSYKGNPYLTCTYGSWSQGNVKHVFKSHDESSILDEKERKELHESFKRQRLEAEKRLEEEKGKVAAEAEKRWAKYETKPKSKDYLAYVTFKKIEPIGAKFGTNPQGYAAIVIPLNNIDGEIRSLQYISLDEQNKSFKTFLVGGEKKGNFFIIGEITEGTPFYISEGYATGVSVFMAEKKPVVIAFDAGNIGPVLENLRKKYPKNEITIAGDADDTGREKAVASAKKYNCKVVFPVFQQSNSDEKKYTDFNDLHQLSGIDEVKKQLTEAFPTIIREPIFKPYTFNDLLEMPPKKWLIDQVFGSGDLGMIYGPPGCGKTFIVIDLIIKLCTGRQWANRFDVERGLNIAYCAGEGISGLPSRFAAAAKHYGITAISNFTFYKTIPQLYTETQPNSIDADQEITTIKQFSIEWKTRQLSKEAEALDVLVIDTLHTATTAADENSARDMGKVLQACRSVADELGCTVILVHHTNKTGSAERGSSSLRGAMDFMLEIKKPLDTERKAILSCSKLKDGEQWQEQPFDLCAIEDYSSVFVKWGDPINQKQPSGSKATDKKALKAEMEKYPGRKFTCKVLAESIAKSDDYTRKLLKEIEDAKECKRELADLSKSSSSKNPWTYWV